MLTGLHLTADLAGCDPRRLPMTDAPALQAAMLAAVAACELNAVAHTFKAFTSGSSQPAGVTGVVVLAESHAAVHTWPELGVVTLDVHVCNLGHDNSAKARRLAEVLVSLFAPEAVHRHEVRRGQTWLEEPLNGEQRHAVRSRRRCVDTHTGLQRLEVHENAHFGRVLRLDGVLQTSERDEFFYHEAIVHTAAALHPAAAHALVVGGGDGGALRQLLKYRSMRKVVLVELDPQVIDAARTHLHAVHRGAFDDPRVEVVIADGADHVARTHDTFDLIVLDLPDPSGGCEALYGDAFFRRCADRLNPGGRLSLHLGSSFADMPRLQRIHSALAATFANVQPFRVPVPLYGGEWLMAHCGAAPAESPTADRVNGALVAQGVEGLDYYNGEVHMASLAMPNYLRHALRAGQGA